MLNFDVLNRLSSAVAGAANSGVGEVKASTEDVGHICRAAQELHDAWVNRGQENSALMGQNEKLSVEVAELKAKKAKKPAAPAGDGGEGGGPT